MKNRRSKYQQGLEKDIDHDRRQVDAKGGGSLMPTGVGQRWICRNGEHMLDILPYFAGRYDPEKKEGQLTYKFKYWYHRDVGPQKLWILCRASMGYGDCPICDHQAELIEQEAAEERYLPLSPKPRMLYNVIVYDKGEERKGVQYWDESEFYSQENIMAIAKKRSRSGKPGKTIDFTHVDDGKTIAFERKAPKGKNDFPKYVGFTLEDRDYSISNEHLEACLIFDEVIPVPSEDDVAEMAFTSRGARSTRTVSRDEDLKRKIDYDDDDKDTPDPYEMLDEAEEKSDLREIVRRFGLDIVFKGSMKFGERYDLVKDALDEMHEQSSRTQKDDDSSSDPLTADEVEDMSWKALVKVMKDNDLDLDLDDYEDEAELASAIIKELELI